MASKDEKKELSYDDKLATLMQNEDTRKKIILLQKSQARKLEAFKQEQVDERKDTIEMYFDEVYTEEANREEKEVEEMQKRAKAAKAKKENESKAKEMEAEEAKVAMLARAVQRSLENNKGGSDGEEERTSRKKPSIPSRSLTK